VSAASTDVSPAVADDRRAGKRALRALPVLLVYAIVSAVYVWQASGHPTPWLFSDEIEYSQIARAIAETGEPARRGVAYGGAGLFPWLVAPFWRINNLSDAYTAVKTFDALVMAAAVLPAYGLARMVASRPYALIAAVGTGIIPAFIYSAMVMQEPVAYFTAALGFFLAARAIASPTRGRVAAAIAVAVVAPFVRDELVLIPLVLVAGAAARWLCFGGGGRRLSEASWRWRAGCAAGAIAALVVGNAVLQHGAGQWATATEHPSVMIDQALWAWAALAIGIGVFPVVIGLAMLVPARSIVVTPEAEAFTAVLATAVAGFTVYVAVKGAYQAATFEARVSERNLAYLSPLLFVALALFVETRVVRPWMLMLAAAFAGWSFSKIPLAIENGLAADAPGLSILAWLHSDHDLGRGGADRLLFALLAASVLVSVAPALLRRHRRAALVIVAIATVLALGWSGRGELAASRYSNDFSKLFLAGLPKPLDWVDRETGGQPVVYLGQKIADPNGVWSMEFWNRSVRQVWSLDGTAPGPGPVLTPNLVSPDGRLTADPHFPFAIADNGVTLAGDVVAERGLLRLVRVERPLRLRESVRGLFSDGWIGSSKPADTVFGDYSLFDAPKAPGTAYVTLSRTGFCGPKAPGRVLIDLGTLGLGPERNGVIDRVTERRGWVVDSCGERTFEIPTPGGPFHVTVSITPPFQPAALDPRQSERRYLGAQFGVRFEPGPP
jgi:hypothetical protein